MKKLLLKSALAVIAILFSLSASAQLSVFDGTWKTDRTKSTITGYFPVLTRITVRMTGDSLLTERYYDTGDGQEWPFTENLTLDNKEHSITIYDMPRKSKCSLADGILTLESVTIANGSEEYISIETWKIDKDTLTISFKNKSSEGETDGAFLLTRVR